MGNLTKYTGSYSCKLKEQGVSQGSCLVKINGKCIPACQATLKYGDNTVSRLITSIHLSRPENYLSTIPFTILAFFPEHQMKNFQSPNTMEMVEAYQKVKATGLQHVRLGNVGVFARTEEDQRYLVTHVEQGAY